MENNTREDSIAQEFISSTLKKLDRGLVATPDEKYLEEFTKANHGSNDFPLMQMAKQYGYKLALEHLQEELSK